LLNEIAMIQTQIEERMAIPCSNKKQIKASHEKGRNNQYFKNRQAIP
jgi:hypothetical protein